MKRKKTNIRAIVTSAILLILVIVAAWTVKARSQKEKEQEVVEVEVTQPTEAPKEEPQPEPEPEQPVEEPEEPDRLAEEEEQRAARERETFVTDYTSAPLLETTPIKCLSMEVGKRADEVRFNWMSPGSGAGQVVLRNVETGETASYTAE